MISIQLAKKPNKNLIRHCLLYILVNCTSYYTPKRLPRKPYITPFPEDFHISYPFLIPIYNCIFHQFLFAPDISKSSLVTHEIKANKAAAQVCHVFVVSDAPCTVSWLKAIRRSTNKLFKCYLTCLFIWLFEYFHRFQWGSWHDAAPGSRERYL